MTQLLPSISKAFDGQIWRIEIDEETDTIYLEVRRTEDKVVSFAAINQNTGNVLFENLSVPERWLTGIETAFNGVLLLHGYQSQNSPLHRGITAVNSKGEELWSNYAITFDYLSVNGPVTYAAQIQPRKLFLTDVSTGANLRQYEQQIDKPYANHIISPELKPVCDLNFQTPLPSYNGVLDYIAFNDYRIVSLHTLFNGVLKQCLYVWKEGELVYEDLLNDNIQKMQPEAFILFKNRVVYIKNKIELKVLDL